MWFGIVYIHNFFMGTEQCLNTLLDKILLFYYWYWQGPIEFWSKLTSYLQVRAN